MAETESREQSVKPQPARAGKVDVEKIFSMAPISSLEKYRSFEKSLYDTAIYFRDHCQQLAAEVTYLQNTQGVKIKELETELAASKSQCDQLERDRDHIAQQMQQQQNKFARDFSTQVQHNARQLDVSAQQIKELREQVTLLDKQLKQWQTDAEVLKQQNQQLQQSTNTLQINHAAKCQALEERIRTILQSKKTLNVQQLGTLNEEKLTNVAELKHAVRERYGANRIEGLMLKVSGLERETQELQEQLLTKDKALKLLGNEKSETEKQLKHALTFIETLKAAQAVHPDTEDPKYLKHIIHDQQQRLQMRSQTPGRADKQRDPQQEAPTVDLSAATLQSPTTQTVEFKSPSLPQSRVKLPTILSKSPRRSDSTKPRRAGTSGNEEENQEPLDQTDYERCYRTEMRRSDQLTQINWQLQMQINQLKQQLERNAQPEQMTPQKIIRLSQMLQSPFKNRAKSTAKVI